MDPYDIDDIQQAFNGSVGNCSLYALPSGNLTYYENQSTILRTYHKSSFPAYFITNCSQEGIDFWLNYTNFNEDESTPFWGDSYQLINNGDSFVSFLFTISGVCVACWMLSFLLILSPKHKRRPMMTQIATVFNAVVLTILLSKITATARVDYYSDHVDVYRIHDVFFNDLTYRVTNVFSEAFISFSFFQVVSRIASKLLQDYVVIAYAMVLIVYVCLGMVCEIDYRLPLSELSLNKMASRYVRYHQARNVFKLLMVSIVGLLLIYYTVFIKNPRKYSYSKKMLPLAIFVWILFLCHFTVCVSMMIVFVSDWSTRSWLSILPSLLEIVILTVIWEWIYNIKALERRYELLGVLGRRISFDDDRIFQTDDKEPRRFRKHRTKIVSWVKDMTMLHKAPDIVDESDNNLKMLSDLVNVEDISEDYEVEEQHSDGDGDGDSHGHGGGDGDIYHHGDVYGDGDDLGGQGYQGAPVDESDTPVYEQVGSSSRDPPRFEAHPGFNRGDYWPEKTTG